MEINLKSLVPIALGAALAVAGTSSFAKGHDQGVADGFATPENTGQFSRNGAVAGVDVPGIGSAAFGGLCAEGFCGVVGDAGQTYGRDIVAQQRAADIRRVHPVVGNGRNGGVKGN